MDRLYPPLAEPPLERAVLVPSDPRPVPNRPQFASAWQPFLMALVTRVEQIAARVDQVTVGGVVIAGGPAGPHTVPGLPAGATLTQVTHYETSGGGGSIRDIFDRTAEFTVTGANTASNAGGTDTTSDKLQFSWWYLPED